MDIPSLSTEQSGRRIKQLASEGFRVIEGNVNGERVVIKQKMEEGQKGNVEIYNKAPPGPVFEAAMNKASSLDLHYDKDIKHQGMRPLKNKMEVTNIGFGRSIPTLTVDSVEEPVPQAKDMTRQIPRYNTGTPMGLTEPYKVASIRSNVQHVPRRAPVVVHGLNSLNNSQANVITGDAEYFGTQQSVKALRDSLNFDPLDVLKKDMLRVNKADAKDEITAKSGLHNTFVKRSRVRQRAGQIYV